MKKIFSIFGALLAGAMMFSCADQYEEEITFGTEISASVEALAEFAAEDAEAQTFDVEANGEWSIIAPSWLEISPRAGEAGTTTVTVKPTNNYMMVEQENGEMVQELGYAREATIQIAGEQDMQVAVDADGDGQQDVDEEGELVWESVSALAEVLVKQAGDPDKVYTGPEKLTVAEFIKRADAKTPYELTGTITRVANTYYGNFDLTDETGTIYIYGLLDAEGEKCYEAKGLKLGDIITVQGTYTLYNTTHEIVNATYISHEEGGPVEIMPSSIGDFLEAANPSQLYELTGVVKNITSEVYGNFDLVDATGSVYVYGLLTEEGGASKQFASLDIQEGDILTLVGNYATYNEQAQVGSAYHVSHIDVSAKTVAEFLAAEEGSDYYMLTGTIANLKDGDKYGNIDLVDETGSVYVYGVHVGYGGSNGQFQQLVEAHGLKNGDTLTIIGQRGSYNGKDQVVKGFYYSHETGEGGGEEPEQPTIVDATVAEFIAAAEDDTQYRVQGVVTQIAKAEFGNVYIKDATGEVYVYGIGAKGEFETMGIEVGDIVTLVSVRASYNGAAQLKSATLESKIDVTAATVAEFLATEESSEKYYMLTGTVDTVGDNDKYGNFNITDESGSVYVYGMLAGWGGEKGQFQTTVANTGLKSGDKLTLIGYHTSYKEAPQVGGAFYFTHEAGEVVEPEDPETPGGTLAWGSADFAAIQAAVGNELNATTLAAVTATEDLIVNTDGITYKGLELSLGGGKFKFGTNYGVASQEGDKPTRIQVGGAGNLADMKQIISFEVPAAGTLKVDAVSSSKDEVRPFAVAIDGNEIGQYTTVLQGQESTGEIFTIDCSAATAGSTIYLYSAKSGINFFTIEYTY